MRTQTRTTDSLNTKLLLKALVAFKKGDFSEPTSDHLTLEPVEPTKMPPDEAQALLERLKQWQLRR